MKIVFIPSKVYSLFLIQSCQVKSPNKSVTRTRVNSSLSLHFSFLTCFPFTALNQRFILSTVRQNTRIFAVRCRKKTTKKYFENYNCCRKTTYGHWLERKENIEPKTNSRNRAKRNLCYS